MVAQAQYSDKSRRNIPVQGVQVLQQLVMGMVAVVVLLLLADRDLPDWCVSSNIFSR